MRTQALWDYFTKSKAFHHVETLLSQGENVIVVFGDGKSMCTTYNMTTDPEVAAIAVMQEMVRQTGVPLPIDDDGRRCFAFLAWKSTDPIDVPSKIHNVTLANDADQDMCTVLQATGVGTFMKTKTVDKI